MQWALTSSPPAHRTGSPQGCWDVWLGLRVLNSSPETIAWPVQAGLIPSFVMATVGTTSSCAVDPLQPLSDVSQRHGVW